MVCSERTRWVPQVLNRPKNSSINQSFQIYSDQNTTKRELKTIYCKNQHIIISRARKRWSNCDLERMRNFCLKLNQELWVQARILIVFCASKNLTISLINSLIMVQTPVWLKSFFYHIGLSYKLTGIFSMQIYSRELICAKKGCLTLNVLIVANLLPFLLNPQKGKPVYCKTCFSKQRINQQE